MDSDKIIEKLAEETAKQSVGKLTEGICSFFSSICMPAAEEFGLLLRDQIAHYRLRNLFQIVRKTQKILKQHKAEGLGTVSPKLLNEYVSEATWAEDENIQNMWAGLLAAEAIHGSGSDDAIIYVNTLKSLSAYEARIIDLLYGDDRIASVENPSDIFDSMKSPLVAPYGFFVKNPIHIPIKVLLDASPTGWNNVVQNRSHEQIINDPDERQLAYGYLVPILQSLKRQALIGLFERTEDSKDNINFVPTTMGLDFYMRCTGYRIYPLEAYILTRGHWCKEKNINPFEFNPYSKEK